MEHIYLSHHGIKGQKWGVRRFQLKNGRLTAAGKKRYSEDEEEQKKKAEEESAPKKKSISEMSDQELREAINRAQLEESYRRYFEPAKQQPEIGLGEKFVQASKDVLKKQVVDPTLSSFSRSISTAVDKKISEKLGIKPKTINDLLKTDVRKLSPDELQKVVNYNNNLKTYREQQKYNSVDSEVDRMQKERNDRRKSQIDMEQQELNLRMKRATVEKMEEERRKARETVMDVVKDVASQTVNEYRSPSEERAKAVVDKYFDEPLMLPKPDDDVKHSDILEHHGIKGQRWGVRRFQDEGGQLTKAGKQRKKTTVKKERDGDEKKLSSRRPREYELYENAGNLASATAAAGGGGGSLTADQLDMGRLAAMFDFEVHISTADDNLIDKAKGFVANLLNGKFYRKLYDALVHDDMDKYDDILEHHGIKGQKWGVRRFQSKEGQLTKLGKARQARYAKATLRATIRQNQNNAKIANKMAKKAEKHNQVEMVNSYILAGKEFEKRASRSKEYLTKIKAKEVEAGKDYVASRCTSLSFNWINGVGYTTTTALKTNSGINAEYRYTIY